MDTVSIAYLDGVRMNRALQAGIARVLSRQEYLNKINVFPVPDADTGTNIAFTLQSVLAGLTQRMDRHVGNTLTRVADSALDGARGNSGAIIAQFFQGLSDSCAQHRVLTTQHFARAMKAGADYAREALTEPQEGTILSVLTDFAAELDQQMRSLVHKDFVGLLEAGLRRAEASLANTPNQMELLRKAGVVDAGAQGFVDMLTGAIEFMRTGSLREMPELDIHIMDEGVMEAAGEEIDLSHRYCTECIVEGTDIDRRKLREELAALGSSLVLAGSARRAKIHIHTDEPQTLFDLAARYGRVMGQKADDMQRQQSSAHALRGGVVVLTDSAADVRDTDMERLDIQMVPIRLHFGGVSYLDKVSITSAAFYRELVENPLHPKTSQPPPGDFRRQYQYLVSHYDSVVSIHLSSRVSGTFQAAESAAARVRSASPVITIDSRNVSLGQGLLAMYAAECAEAGFDSDAVVMAVEAMIPRTRTWGVLPDLTYAVRGGRVGRSKKLLADLLHLTPVLATRPDGSIGPGGVLLGRSDLPRKFARFVARRLRKDAEHRLAVGHCNDPEAGEALLELLAPMVPGLHSSYLTEAGSALGVHAGPGGLVVGIQEYQPPT